MSEAKSSFRKHVLALLGEGYGDKTLVLCPTVFVRLLHGDHKAAILLSQILYWSDRTKDADGWFYKSYADWTAETGLSEAQVRRIVNGDPRVQSPQLTLRDLGIETLLRKVKHTGAPTLHYRINQAQFLGVLHAFLGQGDSSQCAGSISGNAEDELTPTSGMNPEGCAVSFDPKTPTEISPKETTSESSDDDFLLFTSYEHRFGPLKERFRRALRDERVRLGVERVGQVLERCATRGRSWSYVLKALVNEETPTPPSETSADSRWDGSDALDDAEVPGHPQMPETVPLRASERLQTPWANPLQPDSTVLDAWNAALHQLEMQFGRDFYVWGVGLTLVDFEANTFTLVARTAHARDLLQHRLNRSVERILRDVFGQPVEMRFLIAEEWAVRC